MIGTQAPRNGSTNRKACATLILLACCPGAFALNPSLDVSQYAHTSWKIRDGFFKGAISSIAQTPDGYLWLGTNAGLLRFDGIQSVPWQPPAGEHLPSDVVTYLLTARDGRLWIGTRQGLASWKNDRLTHYPDFAGREVAALLEDHEETIWASIYGAGTGKLCAIRGSEARCYGEDGTFGVGVSCLYEDSRGNLWVGGGVASVWRWRPGPPKLYRLPDLRLQAHALTEDDTGAILIAVRSGIRRLAGDRNEALPVPFKKVNPRAFLRDRNGALWIGTDAGLLHAYQGRTDVFTQQEGLAGGEVGALFEDREGNIWVATYDGGLDHFRDFAVTTISKRQGLSDNWVGPVVAARDGSVWLTGVTGLNRLKDGKITIYGKDNGLPDNLLDTVFEDHRGRVWVFTLRGDGYFENGRFVRVSGVPSLYVRAVAEDGAGDLWVSHDHALFRLHEGSVAERIPWADLGRKEWAVSLLPDATQGGLWLGYFQGGVDFFKDGQVRAHYSAAEGLGEGIVGGLRLDRDGALWAATEGGLSRLKDGRITTLNRRNGLPCDAVFGVVEDDDHAFWLSTSCGLVRIARPELDRWVNDPNRAPKVTVLDNSDGFVVVSIVSSTAKSTDGKLWFTTLGGVSVVDPHHLPFNKIPPPVHIEQVIADRQTFDLTPNLRLPALSRDLEIDYTALSLVAPEKNRFKYKLEGRDRDWQDVGNRRRAFYNDLPPRNYRFRVMASNNSGVWNEAGDTLEFSIAPAYYQTTWFGLASVAVFLALIGALYRYRLHQVTREFNVRLEERVGERVRIARELHDTLLQTVQGLMLRLQVVNEMLPPGRAKDELEETMDIGDRAIIEGRNTVGDLRTHVTTTLPSALRALGDELASTGDANFRVVVEGPVLNLHPIVRDELYRIAREALRNAFAHAGAKHIEAEVTYGDRNLRLRIRDDGEGIPAKILNAGKSGHFGLAGMRERAKQIGSTFTIWSGIGAGTEIDLTVPASIAYDKSPATPRFRLFRKKGGGKA